MKKNFTKGQYVSATTKVNKEVNNVVFGFIDAITTAKGGETLYKVNNTWYAENALTPRTPKSWTPTIGQMIEIKKSYPILKQCNVKVIYECGHDTANGFHGFFGFIWEKSNQSGKLMFRNGEFSKMDDKFARKYGF